MESQKKISKTLNIILWIAQFLLAASLIWSAMIKLFQPIEKLAAMWPWAGEVSPALVRFTGIIDLLGALGLVLPPLLRIKPKLTLFAAAGIIVLMIKASVFHILRDEVSQIGVNVFFAVLAAFIFWGRRKEDSTKLNRSLPT